MHHGIFLGRFSLLGRPSRPKVISIKIFTVSRDRFGLPDIIFFFSRDRGRPGIFGLFRSSAVILWCFLIIVPVAWTQGRPGQPYGIQALITKLDDLKTRVLFIIIGLTDFACYDWSVPGP